MRSMIGINVAFRALGIITVYPAGTLQQPENRHFPGSSPASFPFAHSTEVALVHFNLARKGGGFFHLIGNQLSQPGEERSCRVPVNSHQLRSGPCRGSGHKVL